MYVTPHQWNDPRSTLDWEQGFRGPDCTPKKSPYGTPWTVPFQVHLHHLLDLSVVHVVVYRNLSPFSHSRRELNQIHFLPPRLDHSFDPDVTLPWISPSCFHLNYRSHPSRWPPRRPCWPFVRARETPCSVFGKSGEV